MKHSYHRYGGIGLALLLGLSIPANAEFFVIDSPEKWQSWKIPAGLVAVSDEGHLELVEFHKEINAVLNADQFVHPTQKRGEVSGGIWRVDSGRETAHNIIDGDRETFWQPDPDDSLPYWQIEIDLGRPVLAKEIRLRFPDRDGARPFRQFRVLTATGARIQVSDDIFKFDLAYAATQPNQNTDLVFSIDGNKDTTRVDTETKVDLESEKGFRIVQYIRFAANEKSPDAALAEIEVIGVGDNVSLDILTRGGSFTNGLLARDPQNQFDGQMDTFGNIFTVYQEGDWKEEGLWWQVDLGALFWLDGAFFYWQDRGEALSSFLYDGFHAGAGYAMLSSEGQRTTTGAIDFDPLLLEPKWQNGRERSLRHFRYIFKPRKVRYLLWHGLTVGGHAWYSHPMEIMLFSPGYPAQVTLYSDFIDLSQAAGNNRPKAIKSLFWDALKPPDTRLQLRSRSGNKLDEIYTFYDKKGDLVSEEKWLGLPKVIRGPVDTSVVIGAGWGEWSNFYQISGESFQSESPRRYIQLELIMSTDDPTVAPTMRSLAIEFDNALVQRAQGRILPRNTDPNTDTRFTYTLWPSAATADSGFDRLRLSIPGAASEVALRVGTRATEISALRSEGDSLLFIDLPEVITNDSVAVEFTTKVLRNATLFTAELGAVQQPGLWQSVEAIDRRANTVFLPQLARTENLIGDLQVTPSAFTPDDDGINDSVYIRFALFKVEGAEPQVRIYDLSGRLVAEATPSSENRGIKTFSWTGVDLTGQRVRPGIYLCRIDTRSDAGVDAAVRSIAVAY